MDTPKTIEVINRLQAEGLISRWALGGAFGALFYLDPTETEDIDVFIYLSPAAGDTLVTLEPIHRRLRELGYSAWEEDNPVVEGWPVQFLPVAKPVEVEALEGAVPHEIESGLSAFVLRPEHLIAIALDLGRPKDKVRLEQFWREKAYDAVRLREVLRRHGLEAKWERLLALFAEMDD